MTGIPRAGTPKAGATATMAGIPRTGTPKAGATGAGASKVATEPIGAMRGGATLQKTAGGKQQAWDTWSHDSCNKDWRYEPADSTKKPELWKQTSWYKALQRKTTTDMPTPRKTPPCKLWKGSPKVPSGSPAGPMEKQVLDEAMEDEIKQDVQEMKGKRKSRARYMRFYRGITGVGLLAVAVLSC